MKGNRYICFSLGAEEYAIPLLCVREVIAIPEFTPIPYTPSYFLGIMNLRGQVISVMDLRTKLGIKGVETHEQAVIICDLDPLSIGIVVDSINSVIAPEDEDVSEKHDLQNSKTSEFVTTVYRRDQRLVLFLDIAKALNVDEITRLTRQEKPQAKAA